MPDFKAGIYVKLLAYPLAEARCIMAVVDALEKPLQCLPASQVIASEGFLPTFEYYAYAEVREADPKEYSVMPRRVHIVNAISNAFRDFKQYIGDNDQFTAFKEVIELFQQDQLAGPVAQQVLDAAITRFNKTEPQDWSTIYTDFVAESAVPEIGLERFKVALDAILTKYINKPAF